MPPSRAQARLAEFLETAERLKNERAAAGSVLETLEATPPPAWPTLATRPEFQTNAALERLGEEVHRRIDRNPREALAVADLAVAIADALPATAYPSVTLAQIRATAWKDRATVLRFLGRIPETFEAIHQAEEILDKHVALGLDRAVVDMVRALALVDTGDFDQARALAVTCGSVFLAHGDLNRALQAGEIEGLVLLERQCYADAETLFKSLLDVARTTNDIESEARCHHNLACCAMFLNDYKAANIQFSEAITKLTDLGQSLAATRTRLGAGKLLIEKGQTDNGLQYLYVARDAFTEHCMPEEAGLCALFIAEALLTHGDNVRAREIIRDVAQELRESNLERRIIEAVSKLEQDMLDSDEAIEAVRHVSALIDAQRPMFL